MATVSIIVPVYNAEKYLREALDSVLAQTFSDWQMILVDDGSTDSSSEICDLYAEKDPRIEVVHVKNGGLSYARNSGLKLATGKWLTFLDSDDCLHPEFLKFSIEAATMHDANVVVTQHTVGNARDFPKINLSFKHKLYPPEQAIELTLYQSHNISNSAWGKLYHRSIFMNTTFTEGLYYEDLDIFYKLYIQSRHIVSLPVHLYFYRQHSESFVHKWDHRRLDVLTVVNRMENYIAEHYPNLLPAAKDRKLSANFNIFNLAVQHGEDEVANKCWSVIKKYRWEDFKNPKIRLKNRIGILASYLGRTIYSFIAKFC